APYAYLLSPLAFLYIGNKFFALSLHTPRNACAVPSIPIFHEHDYGPALLDDHEPSAFDQGPEAVLNHLVRKGQKILRLTVDRVLDRPRPIGRRLIDQDHAEMLAEMIGIGHGLPMLRQKEGGEFGGVAFLGQ